MLTPTPQKSPNEKRKRRDGRNKKTKNWAENRAHNGTTQCTGRQKRERWEEVGRTLIHARHLGRVPFWDIRIEGISFIKHCKEAMSMPWMLTPTPQKSPNEKEKNEEQKKITEATKWISIIPLQKTTGWSWSKIQFSTIFGIVVEFTIWQVLA